MVQIIFLSLVIASFIGGGIYFVIIFNGLKTLKNNIDKALANIDVLLKQRFDEIPQLVKVCESYIGYENKILKDLTELRKKYEETRGKTTIHKGDIDISLAEKISGLGELNQKLTEKFAGLGKIAESHPDLKASTQFLHLQTRVSDLEMEIADRREFYNDSVNSFNIRIESLPDMFVARFLSYKKQELLKIEEKEREIPSVEVTLK